MDNYYDEKYFEWQKEIGEFGGKANLFKFEKYIKGNEDILEFGCGGGYMLKNIQTNGKKCGVEINPVAANVARENGADHVWESIDDVPDNSFDLAISNHALEHVENPIQILLQIKKKLRKGGSIVIVVPHETLERVSMDDKNMHLYTWSPQNLFNLFKCCGLKVEECGRIAHKWPPHYIFIQQKLGWSMFHRFCRLYSTIWRKGYQTYCYAKVNSENMQNE